MGGKNQLSGTFATPTNPSKSSRLHTPIELRGHLGNRFLPFLAQNQGFFVKNVSDNPYNRSRTSGGWNITFYDKNGVPEYFFHILS